MPKLVDEVPPMLNTILGLAPLFFSLGIMSTGVALAVGGLKNAGVM